MPSPVQAGLGVIRSMQTNRNLALQHKIYEKRLEWDAEDQARAQQEAKVKDAMSALPKVMKYGTAEQKRAAFQKIGELSGDQELWDLDPEVHGRKVEAAYKDFLKDEDWQGFGVALAIMGEKELAESTLRMGEETQKQTGRKSLEGLEQENRESLEERKHKNTMKEIKAREKEGKLDSPKIVLERALAEGTKKLVDLTPEEKHVLGIEDDPLSKKALSIAQAAISGGTAMPGNLSETVNLIRDELAMVSGTQEEKLAVIKKRLESGQITRDEANAMLKEIVE